MSDRASAWAWIHHGIPSGVKFTLVALAHEADGEGKVRMSALDLAGKIEKNRSSVIRNIKWLEKAGLVTTEHQYGEDGQQTRNVYRLNTD